MPESKLPSDSYNESDSPSIQELGSHIVGARTPVGESDATKASAQESPQLVTDIGPAGRTTDIDGNTIATDELEDDVSGMINLAVSLMAECKAGLSLSELNNVVFLFRQVKDSHPATHLLHRAAKRDLASVLGVRFMYTNHRHDLMESLTLHNEIVKGWNLDQEASPETNTAIQLEDKTDTEVTLNLAKGLLTNFQKSTSLHILNDIVFLVQQALPQLSAASTSWFIALTTLVDALYARFNHSYNLTDLNEAISSLQDASKCCMKPDQQESNMNFRICGLLATRFDLMGDISDLPTALDSTIRGTKTSTGILESLKFANQLCKQFTMSGNMAYLNTAVTLLRRGIAKLPQGSENHAAVVNNLANALLTRFEQGGQQSDLDEALSLHRQQGGQRSDLDEAISLHRQALKLFLPPHPKQSSSLNNLANALSTRFEQGGQQSDLNEAISLYRQALELRLPPHPLQSRGTLHNLASALVIRFEQGGQQSDLNEGISLHRQALQLFLPPHPFRSNSLNNLANALWTQFEQGGQQSDLDEAISLHRQALELRLQPHPNRPTSLNNLASALSTRFEQGGQQSDLDEAIFLQRQALELFLPPHPLRPSSLHNLASALSTRFWRRGQQSDIDEAISLHRQALELFLPPHPLRSSSLHNLASALSIRFRQVGQQSDLNEAISLQRQALKLFLPPHPLQSSSLNNLANALLTQFQQGGQQSDLDEAISLHRQALKLRLPPHLDRSSSLHNLASALSTQFQQGGQQSDLDKAMSLFLAATQYPFQSPSNRLRVARGWTRCADRNQHSSAIDAYEASIQALPRVAALSLDVASRQDAMTAGSDGLARDAARCAIRSGCIDKAIELLEAGRSIFWSQVLSLRSPFDQLHKIAPELADKLRSIATKLEIGSHRDVFSEISDNRKKLSIEQEAARLNHLNQEWAQSIHEVRKLSGFEDFLCPSRLSSLKAAASEHPVVILIANDDESHCLIMTSTIIHHIPLPNLGTPTLKELVHKIQIAGSQSPISRLLIDQTQDINIELLEEERAGRVSSDTQLRSSDDLFKSVLRMLWDELVKPVINVLNIKKSDKMTVLQWCPTGHFTFLPIHAAGCYDDKLAIDCAPDYFISSYTPTIGALLALDSAPDSAPTTQSFQMMAVIQSKGLRYTRMELENIQRHVPSEALIKLGVPEVPAGVEAVASHLSSVSIVHFACHGNQNPQNPLDSGLTLDDGLLRISRIMKEKMPNGSLAFLCACETAVGDQNLPDEAMSIGASLIFSGFRRVIATMWKMSDEDGPTIVDTFYEELFSGSPDGRPALKPDMTKSALALHLAVKKLRSQGVPFRRWVPFIHMGK
ncbi:uncharacterized protein LACBIDRAFT_318922 [Laccaria bicolor S238N-H82]|uniref:Predicted protein n=1 Tax=Laccaria bicolor (strain S238N-H82 / ATCC MYA-4686) TaxID=486041 RepID=B0D7F7_LACBS|nr:uncharacterized protein LACBIDRAFT_318922 [Laccaria bicolor S238N-H82]EDR09388.1 predicted protein [Laccaria bicolor S238N-H82]|eukprot:XP_001879737.1 predicted protein [Laccaria bicolor S238N-H82]